MARKPYKKVYLEYFGYGEQDYIPCENCGNRAVDVHHLKFRSQGGEDIPENLMGLCRDCHNRAHGSKPFNQELIKKHLSKIKSLR